ncbi:MAG TPA: hypothetical protein VL402_08430 [Xanthobacteraceae bacterium]|jgi:hypothetical protein|nr:hypothetical protein [Xanthobacteraceae bacterium]
MRTTSLLLQVIILAIAVHFACYFTYEAAVPFSIVDEPDLARISAVMSLARLFALGSTGAFIFISVLSVLKWGTAVLLFGHIVDRATKLERGIVHPGIFDVAVVLTVLSLALTMAGSILAGDVHSMRLTGMQLIATAVMALCSDLVLYWAAPASDEFDRHDARDAWAHNAWSRDSWAHEPPAVTILLPNEGDAASIYAHRWTARIRTNSLLRWADMRSRNI